jgi:hypothetical protein
VYHRIETTVISRQLCNCCSALGGIGDITTQDHWRATRGGNIGGGFLGCFWSAHTNSNNGTR